MAENNVRVYVNDPVQAAAEVRTILKLLKAKGTEKRLYFDTETMPAKGLQAYPTTLRGAIGVNGTRKTYQHWVQWVTFRDFDVEKFKEAGTPLPLKIVGKYAVAAWKAFGTAVLADPEKYRAFMLPAAEVDFRYWLHAVRFIHEKRTPKNDPVKPGLNPHDSEIFAVQFTVRKNTGQKISWVFETPNTTLEAVRPVLEWAERQRIPLVGQNLKFDLGQIRHHLGEDATPTQALDTLVFDRIMTLGMKGDRSLGALAFKYLQLDIDKAVRSSFVGVRRERLTGEQLEYSFVDTEILPELLDEQIARATAVGQLELATTFSNLNWLTSKWEHDGFIIDAEMWLELTKEANTLRDNAANELEALLLGTEYNQNFGALSSDEEDEEGEEEVEVVVDDEEDDTGDGRVVDTRKYATVKLSQTAIVAELAAPLLELDLEELDTDLFSEKTGRLSLGKDARSALEYLYVKKHGHGHAFFDLYAKWTAMAKQSSTYGAKFLHHIHPITGRAHSSFNIAGTDTGRYSSNAPNFLNLPRGDHGIDVRQAVVATPQAEVRRIVREVYEAWTAGDLDKAEALIDAFMVVGGADYATFEARAAAEYSQDPGMLAIFDKGIDYHSGAAVLAFHLKKSNVAKPEKRNEEFRIGSNVFKIDIWYVPNAWTSQKVLDFALTKEIMKAVIKPTRQIAKTVNFLILFGGGAYSLAGKVNITVDQAEAVLLIFQEAFPTLFEVVRETEQLPFGKNMRRTKDTPDGKPGRVVGFVQTLGFLRRYFPMPTEPRRHNFPYTEEGEKAFQDARKKYFRSKGAIRRQAFNVTAQGLNAEVTAEALLLVQERGRPHRIVPWLAVYDQILVLMPASILPSIYAEVVEGSMLDAAKKYLVRVPVAVELDPPSPRMQKEFTPEQKHGWKAALLHDIPWNTGYHIEYELLGAESA